MLDTKDHCIFELPITAILSCPNTDGFNKIEYTNPLGQISSLLTNKQKLLQRKLLDQSVISEDCKNATLKQLYQGYDIPKKPRILYCKNPF